jgi:hypothetical protein
MPLTRQRDRDWLALLAARRDLRFAALCEFIMWHHGAPETLTPTRIVEIAKELIEIWHDDDTGDAVTIDVRTPYGSLLPLLDELAAIDNAIEEIE